MTDELGSLSSWLIDAGGHHHGLELRALAGMRGAAATRSITVGTELAQIPRSVWISVEAARGRLAERQMCTPAVEEMSELTQLALWLLVEDRDPHSAFRPYLDALPKSFSHFPINVAPADLALLAGSLTGALVDHQRATLESDHARLEIDVPWFRSISFDEFVSAKLCVSSRAFEVVMDGKATKVLVPFLDMLNHEAGPNIRWPHDADHQVLRLVAQRAYAPGEQVFNDYGSKSNAYFLLHYGFCIEDNEADQAVIGSTEQFRVLRTTDGPAAQRMLAQLRARCGNEGAARASLAEAARASLAQFSTTIADDEALLAGEGLSAHARNFVIARLGEKRVLQAWLERATDGPAELFR